MPREQDVGARAAGGGIYPVHKKVDLATFFLRITWLTLLIAIRYPRTARSSRSASNALTLRRKRPQGARPGNQSFSWRERRVPPLSLNPHSGGRSVHRQARRDTRLPTLQGATSLFLHTRGPPATCGACTHILREWRGAGPASFPHRGQASPYPGPPPPPPDARRETPTSCSGRTGALVPARACAPSPATNARGPCFLPTLHGTSSPFLHTRGPTPQATRAPLPRRTVSALSCARVARHEPPAVLRCAGPTLAREREARASPSHSCSRGAAQAPRFQRARRQHPCFLCQRTIPPRGTPCASAPFLTTQRSASPPFWR
ncbi:hypothetical protein AB1E18_019649 [Capra hircus]